MKIMFPGDTPAWFVGAWLATGLLFVVVTRLLDHRRLSALAAVRPTAHPADLDGWTPRPFSLSVHERNIFGVHHVDQVISFGPSGRQVAAAILMPCGAAAVFIVAARGNPAGWVRVVVGLVSFTGAAFGVSGLRCRVWLSATDVMLRRRRPGVRRILWNEIEDVRCELEPVKVQAYGPTSMAMSAVLQPVGHASIPLPSFRCLAWADTDQPDPVAVTSAKVGIVRRYRECVVGPWPST